ncbi:MAG: hypothetical protein CMM58_06565 [Rhodospirillaceae bacterium]|nr:hypothetical protein [Rhodospirillaceae bacterium]|tara:strand:+ start:323 stop:1096 length:774 start_codon:yes stop_codon:yes gene_type:complete
MLKIQRQNGIEIFTINRPEAGNSIGSDLTSNLLTNLERLKIDKDIHALIITGIGDKFFCTGGDVKEYRKIETRKVLNYHFERTRKVMDLIEELECPVICAVNGFALGGGAELVLCADYRIAAPHAIFGWPQVRLGIIPAWNGIDRLVRDCGSRVASRLMMTGERISANNALELNIIDEVPKNKSALQAALDYAELLKKSAPLALRTTKQVLKATAMHTPEKVRSLQYEVFPLLWFSADHKEAEAAFAEKRNPVFTGE